MQWNAKAEAKLFTAVLRIHNVKLDYQALAVAMGEGVTAKALTHRIHKIKTMAGGGTPTDGNTPNKRTPRSGPGSKGAKANFTAAYGPVDEDDEEEMTPTQKRGVKRAAADDGDDELAELTPMKKRSGKRGAGSPENKRTNGAKKEAKKDVGDEEKLIVEIGGEEEFPLGVEIKAENGVIKVLQQNEGEE